ncbi:hypothetical protein RS584_15580 [Enterobacter sp. DTU_2021_1002640_1_SI_PRY_ASU_LCPMC_013]|uniref:hypothetical protein n=1 Tax=Enterobacter sp. DTU_2021_1002640_1_SI_PRY_ASU_LCPMC_013 TaxID=3077940 RepID=UPI0027FC43BB|nr:hypothetical protein [Enterobacter sp. DTU_2021_1002640_1_SI_PRY_ASU_LCPMC_013]EKY3917433.1 hypothetical protein [Enterobacter hormaechei]WNU99117.1 hypothetical protein RS584_15580 [Enterobacter sp. DTU_2021_1002640_1_SI_PRY_ASU_LCPMC_013]
MLKMPGQTADKNSMPYSYFILFSHPLSDCHRISLLFSHFQTRPRERSTESVPDGHPASNGIYPDRSRSVEVRPDKTPGAVRQLLSSFIKPGETDVIIRNGVTLPFWHMNVRGSTA